jgi:hypothetical protein
MCTVNSLNPRWNNRIPFTVKTIFDFSVPSQDVTYQTGKSLTFFYSVVFRSFVLFGLYPHSKKAMAMDDRRENKLTQDDERTAEDD